MERSYHHPGYNHKERWLAYHYQMNLILETGATSVLEVGPGNKWMGRCLQDIGLEVKTLDSNAGVLPDYVASVEKIPLPDKSFDVVCAFEVLEHLPFETLATTLTEMARVARTHVIISLPDQRRQLLNLSLKLPFMYPINVFWKISRLNNDDTRASDPAAHADYHYFEVGMRDYPLERIRQELERTGLTIVKNFCPRDNPASHYFVMHL